MKPTFTTPRVRYSHLICIFGIANILVAAQEACVKACTKASGTNECIGSIPHTEEDWNILDTTVKSCYCVAAVNFAGCNPSCDITGFDPDTYGRVFGSWRYVNQVCEDAVNQFKATASPSTGIATSTPTPLSFSTIPAQLLNTEVPTATLDAVPGPPSISPPSSPSSSKGRTIAISVSLANFAVLSIGAGLWFWFRRRRQKRVEQSDGDQQSTVVIGADGFPVDQSGPNLVSPMKAEFGNDTINQWIEEQERIKQMGVNMEPDTQTETLSVGYTLWSETDLCFTEIGAEDARDRDMEPIKEEPGGEDEIRSTFGVV